MSPILGAGRNHIPTQIQRCKSKACVSICLHQEVSIKEWAQSEVKEWIKDADIMNMSGDAGA